MFASFFATSSHPFFANMSASILQAFQNLTLYGALYFIFVFFFTYFYTAVTFDPHQISENLQKNGAFIPGVRPGVSTSEYLAKIITRITFVGALFLGLIAVLADSCSRSPVSKHSRSAVPHSSSLSQSFLTSLVALTRRSQYAKY
jgi:preprotein translocase subunit SecY